MNRRAFVGAAVAAVAGLLGTTLPAGLLGGPREPSGAGGPPEPGATRTRAVVTLYRRGRAVGELELAAGATLTIHGTDAGVVGYVSTPTGQAGDRFGVPVNAAVLELRDPARAGPRERWNLAPGDLVVRELDGGLDVRWTRAGGELERFRAAAWPAS